MKKLILFAFSTLLLASCSKKDAEPQVSIDAKTLELKYDKTHQFVLTKGSEAVTASTFTWKSSDEKVGTIDANGNFKGRKIGETKITGTSTTSGAVESSIKITPYTTFITEPVIQFGVDAATIKGKEKRKLSTKSTDNVLLYDGENSNITYVAYFLENGKVAAAFIIFASTATTLLTESVTFFKERYPNIDASDSEVYLLNDEQTYGIILSVDATIGYNAQYVPYKKGGRKDLEVKIKFHQALKNLGVL